MHRGSMSSIQPLRNCLLEVHCTVKSIHYTICQLQHVEKEKKEMNKKNYKYDYS